MKVFASIAGISPSIPLIWKPEYVLPVKGDTLWLEGILSEEGRKMLEAIHAHEVWDLRGRKKNACQTVTDGLLEISERSFYFFEDTGEQYCVLTLEIPWMSRNKSEKEIAGKIAELMESTNPFDEWCCERGEKLRFRFHPYNVEVDVPHELPRYPTVQEYINILPLLSDADRRLLEETGCEDADNLLQRLEDGNMCRVRARGWTKDKESGKWLCVLSVDV